MKQFDLKKIKQFREAAGLTQDALASLMSTDESRVFVQQISAWENRENGGLNVTHLARLAEVLGKQTDDFFIDNQSA